MAPAPAAPAVKTAGPKTEGMSAFPMPKAIPTRVAAVPAATSGGQSKEPGTVAGCCAPQIGGVLIATPQNLAFAPHIQGGIRTTPAMLQESRTREARAMARGCDRQEGPAVFPRRCLSVTPAQTRVGPGSA